MKYYSEKLDRMFDTATELSEAEVKADEAAKEKKLKAEERKTEAGEIEKLYKAKNAAAKEFREEFSRAREAYNNAVSEARKAFEDKVSEISGKKDVAEKAYNKALNEFIAKHPEGYHMTIRDGNDLVTISGSGSSLFDDVYKKSMDNFEKLVDNMTRLLRF